MEQLDGTCGDPRPQRLAQQRMRHRVVMLTDLDVIIEAGLALLPFGVDIRCPRQRLQSWSICRAEQRPAAAAQMPRRAVVQYGHAIADRPVQVRKREKGGIPEL